MTNIFNLDKQNYEAEVCKIWVPIKFGENLEKFGENWRKSLFLQIYRVELKTNIIFGKFIEI